MGKVTDNQASQRTSTLLPERTSEKFKMMDALQSFKEMEHFPSVSVLSSSSPLASILCVLESFEQGRVRSTKTSVSLCVRLKLIKMFDSSPFSVSLPGPSSTVSSPFNQAAAQFSFMGRSHIVDIVTGHCSSLLFFVPFLKKKHLWHFISFFVSVCQFYRRVSFRLKAVGKRTEQMSFVVASSV